MKRKRASSTALRCCCDDIHVFGRRNQDQNRVAHKARRLLYRNQSRTWAITSKELKSSTAAGCPTCNLLMRAIMAFELNFAHVKTVHLRLSRLVPQLRVTVEDFRPRDNWAFYLSHPYGMQKPTSDYLLFRQT
jgi:hypothetical protein